MQIFQILHKSAKVATRKKGCQGKTLTSHCFYLKRQCFTTTFRVDTDPPALILAT